jgi:alpha/beta superfamily hydrolase
MPVYAATITVFLLVGLAGAQQPVSFSTGDGGLIHADLYGEGDRGIVLAHGGRRTKSNWERQARTLVNAGFRVIAFDFRGHGQSRAGRSGDDGVRFDVLAAVRYLRENGAKTVSVVGASFGGWAAAQASTEARPGEIDRLVILAGEIDEPEKVKVRKLFIVTRDDANDAGPRLPRIRKQYDRAPEPKELVVLDGSAHAQFVFETDQGERLMNEILQFLTRR